MVYTSTCSQGFILLETKYVDPGYGETKGRLMEYFKQPQFLSFNFVAFVAEFFQWHFQWIYLVQ